MAVQTARESRMCSGAVPPLSRPQTAPNECGKKGEKTVFEIFFAHSVLLHEKKGEKKKKKKRFRNHVRSRDSTSSLKNHLIPVIFFGTRR
jgi:hypothetical protein